MRGPVTGCLLLVYVVALLAEQAEGHIAFFSPKEMRELRVRHPQAFSILITTLLTSKNNLLCFSFHLQQEKEGRKDADSMRDGVLTDEMSPEEDGGESAVRNPCMFLMHFIIFLSF